jgi:hypothetical protein
MTCSLEGKLFSTIRKIRAICVDSTYFSYQKNVNPGALTEKEFLRNFARLELESFFILNSCNSHRFSPTITKKIPVNISLTHFSHQFSLTETKEASHDWFTCVPRIGAPEHDLS